MPVALRVTCYLACVVTLFIAVYMEITSKNAASKAIRLTAQEVRAHDYEVQLRVLLDQSRDKARVGMISAAIGVVLIGVSFYCIKPQTMTDFVGSGLLKALPIIILILYTLLAISHV
jgi:Na+/H+ antiporter NhaB